jgi:hypothetical protein
MWTTAEVDAHRRRQLGNKGTPQHDDVEDPFLAFGKLVKGAWRKVSNKEVPKAAEKEASDEKDKADVTGSTLVLPSGEKRAALVTIVPPNESPPGGEQQQENGGIWEEAVADEFQHREIGQTETIREDETRYPWEDSGSPRAL